MPAFVCGDLLGTSVARFPWIFIHCDHTRRPEFLDDVVDRNSCHDSFAGQVRMSCQDDERTWALADGLVVGEGDPNTSSAFLPVAFANDLEAVLRRGASGGLILETLVQFPELALVASLTGVVDQPVARARRLLAGPSK